jgi:hypothetical protein
MYKKIITIILLSLAFPVLASWDGSASGKINQIQVTAESNYAFRITLIDNPSLCGNSNQWAFLNKDDSNYETYVSLLTAAKFAQAPVTIFANQSTNGYCKIGLIFVN